MKKIAIIDDENDILEVLQKFLSRDSNLSIDTFNNPLNGLSAVENGSYDLVLLDIMMPQMDGLEVLERIKDSNPDVEVVMMTAYDTLERTIEAHKKGATNYLKKPFESLGYVKEKIDKIIG